MCSVDLNLIYNLRFLCFVKMQVNLVGILSKSKESEQGRLFLSLNIMPGIHTGIHRLLFQASEEEKEKQQICDNPSATILNKVGSYWLGQKANNEINFVGHDINTLEIEGDVLDKVKCYEGVFFNYFSIGMDAQVAYGFHRLCNEKPYLAKVPITNKLLNGNTAICQTYMDHLRIICPDDISDYTWHNQKEG
ncbi:uncharacterized protein LOC111308129 [Durio zibethinus]|uniref:Uncharacterized protein LOC111308129 n=1 Tax=Durio zibethinus TaxID=66656 RepID=A0A6P6ABJ9_DURZI|nr:uncharacterized protein LOC111308129 [Durio zibethinus]